MVTQKALRSTTIRIDGELPLVRIGAASGLLWSRADFVLAGIGEATRIPLDRPGGHATAARALSAMVGHNELGGPGTGPVAFASLPFDPDSRGELIVPRVVFGTDGAGRHWVTITDAPQVDGAAAANDAIAEVSQRLASEDAVGDPAAQPTTYELRSQLNPEVWRDEVVAAAVERIGRGELEKAVFARELVLTTDQPISAEAVVQRLASVFPTAALFLVDGFVGASPELLVGRNEDVVRAHPLAGTAATSSDPAVDQRQIAALLASGKDRWEHRITIEWLLDQLLPFCSYVDAEPEPSIVTLANVHHLGTLVEGRLSSPPTPILELVATLHPTPAVGGSPAKEALTLIDELERADRGRYAGPTGWVDADGNGQFAVAIRSAQLGATETRLFAGVGVVADSDPAAELAETRAKFRAMLGALIVP
jgi:menaquinone-specific isochorismate synthase